MAYVTMEPVCDERSAERRKEIMLGTTPERRSSRRYFLGRSAAMEVSGKRYMALIRDWSWTGLFLYSSWSPAVGTRIELVLDFVEDEGRSCSVKCTGWIVRVEESCLEAASGVALAVEKYEVAR